MNKRGVIMSFFVERGETELELEIKATVNLGRPGVTWGIPENCYPPEDDEVVIDYIHLGGKRWDGELTDKEYERLEEKVIQEAHDFEPEPPSDDYEYGPASNDDDWYDTDYEDDP